MSSTLRQAGVLQLIAPKLRTQQRRMGQSSSLGRIVVLALIAVVFWLVLFAILYRMLVYFQGSGVGDVLALKLLSLVLLAFLSILLLSNLDRTFVSYVLVTLACPLHVMCQRNSVSLVGGTAAGHKDSTPRCHHDEAMTCV